MAKMGCGYYILMIVAPELTNGYLKLEIKNRI